MQQQNLANCDALTGVSVIVPLFNEEAVVPELIAHLNTLAAEQIVIVDGGSQDATRDLLRDSGFYVIDGPTGRAKQMNAGAEIATQDMLLFLHADTRLPESYKVELEKANAWGRFDVQFASASKFMKVVAFFINLRSRISCIPTGDQAIFIDRSVFLTIGGYPELPLMEDVAISKYLRQLHRPYSSRERVITSARRWESNGITTTIVKMWWFRLAYFLGVSPLKLKQGYDDVR